MKKRISLKIGGRGTAWKSTLSGFTPRRVTSALPLRSQSTGFVGPLRPEFVGPLRPAFIGPPRPQSIVQRNKGGRVARPGGKKFIGPVRAK